MTSYQSIVQSLAWNEMKRRTQCTIFSARSRNPRHHHTVRIFRTLSLIGLFLAGERGERCQLLLGVFRKGPKTDFVQVAFVVHEYQSQNRDINTLRAAGESEPWFLSLINGRPPRCVSVGGSLR